VLPITGNAMMTSEVPESGMCVELTAAGGPVGGVQVVRAEGAVLTLSLPLPLPAVPHAGASVTLRWPAGARGRYALAGVVLAVDKNRIDVQPDGDTQVEQHRRFVRGGGGESILLRRPGHDDAPGWVRDVSEQGVRAHFAGSGVHEGDEVRLLIELGADVIDVRAVATKVAKLPQRVPPGPMSVEVVAVYQASEAQARIIRRYVLQQQLLARSRD
jgi:hypothetical protein